MSIRFGRNDRAAKVVYQYTVALAGNPNVGKSTMFNALTGMHQHTGNWTGKTVSCASGLCSDGKHCLRLIDLPGTYSVRPQAAEEQLAKDFFCSDEAQAVAVVCDAGALGRNLILVLQLMQTVEQPMLLILNLQNEARKKGIEIRTGQLSEQLGIPVIACEACNKREARTAIAALWDVCRQVSQPDRLLTPKNTPLDAEALALRADQIAQAVTEQVSGRGDRRDRRLDAIFTGRWLGFPVMLALLAALLWITLVGANYLSDALMRGVQWLEGAMYVGLSHIPLPDWVIEAVVFGILRTTGWVVAVMLPPMTIFFPLFTILEDLGYLPRMAFNLDRCFGCCHACGKQALTMCMGFGCNAVGVTGCRIIDSPRERRIAMLTNCLVPCNGRFPTLCSLIALFLVSTTGIGSSIASTLWLLGCLVLCVLVTLLLSRILSATLLKGEASSFVMELPPYRLPRFGQVIVRSVLDRTLFVLGRAVAVAAPAGLILWVLGNVSVGERTLLSWLADGLQPIGWLMGLDGTILLAFLLALPAHEILLPVALMIYSSGTTLEPVESMEVLQRVLTENGWTTGTAVCCLLFLLFHWPCMTTLLTIKKEGGGWRWALLGALIPTLVGFILCVTVATVARLL